jgi:RNA polymerase nonessential primary-like sigma factor
MRALRHPETHGMAGENPEPTLDDVAHLLGKPVEQVRKVLGYNEHVTSLDAPMDADGGASVIEQLADDDTPSPELVLHNSEIEGWIKQWLDELSQRQREVIERRYGLGGNDVATLEQLSQRLGVTRERVRQIEAEALTKLRQPRLRNRLREYIDG